MIREVDKESDIMYNSRYNVGKFKGVLLLITI